VIAEFIDSSDFRWKGFLTRVRHDVYHLPEYTEFSAKHEGGRATAFYAEAEEATFLVPLLIRSVPNHLGAPEGWCDAATPYGYPTPIVGADDLLSISSFLEAFRQAGVERNMVSAFFRLHPLISLPPEPFIAHGSLVKHGQTVYVDLSLPHDKIWSQIRHDHREDIRKLPRSGFSAAIDDWERFDEFIDIYRTTMIRVSAEQFYLFSDGYFADLRATLGERLHLCTVLSPEREVAAAGLFTVNGSVVQAYLAGAATKYLRMAPSKLMIYSELVWAKEHCNDVLHLGGGIGGNRDSLFEFKAGFSRMRSDFYTYRMILNKSHYETLVDLWKKSARAEVEVGSHRFPQYRN
jgi:hypothetical protein